MSNLVLPTPNILVRHVAQRMESERRQLKAAWGEKYATRVGTWKSLISQQMKKRGCGAYEAAEIFIGILKGRKKLTPVMRATITSASLDVMDEKGN